MTCPHCGYCPHCGRSNTYTYPYYNQPYWYVTYANNAGAAGQPVTSGYSQTVTTAGSSFKPVEGKCKH